MMTRFLDWLFPIRRMQVWAEELARFEADCEVFEPDELWASKMSARTPGADRPADASPPLGVGGPLKSDDDVIEELVADYRQFLRDTFRK